MIRTVKPSKNATLWGVFYLFLYFYPLGLILEAVNRLLSYPMDSMELNLLFFFVNALAVVLIFRKYLVQALREGRWRFPGIFGFALLSFVGYLFSSELVTHLILLLEPSFYNANDANIGMMASRNFPLMFFCTVILAPLTEETLFRGLIFRGLFDLSPVLAYAVSIVVFSFIHLTAYLPYLDALTLALSFLQYLPAGLFLARSYHLSGSILSPMLMHAAINALAMLLMKG